jgi:hypothetical protein
MSITPWLPAVRKIKDGETVEQATINVPIDQLTQREQHLYEKFNEILNKSVLISFNQPIHPSETIGINELSIVYYRKDEYGEGVAKGVTGFTSSKASSMFTPKESNYSFGLLKNVYVENKSVDIFTEGLCELDIDLDDPVRGVIKDESFEVGPYFLSPKYEGKITKSPSGIPVYIGYAINKRKFLLHTNVDEFSQFFINYRYHLLDRVAGEPTLSQGVWTITLKEYQDPAQYVDGSGSSVGVAVSNVSTGYTGTPSRGILRDTYTITVTASGNISAARFSIDSASSSFLTKTNQQINSNLLVIENSTGNDIKLDFSGSTNFTLGSRWKLTVSTQPRKLGWIPAESARAIPPDGAVFYYNIPGISDISEDTGLDYYLDGDDEKVEYEKDEALELKKYIPPVPANFIQLYVDGLLVRFNDAFDTSGVFSVNEYGLWWHSNADGTQPWSSSYPQGSLGAPHKWSTSIKAAVASTRKRMFASFSKFNPALRTQLVSSLVGFNTDTNKSANFIKFYSADNVNQTAGTGDLLVDIIAPVHAVGYKANVVDPQDITDDFVYPGEATPQEAARSSTFSSNRAVAALKYSKKDGALKVALTPVVSGLEGSGGITITKDPATGNHTIGYLSEGYTGYVDSIEPINARLEFRGLTSYIKLPIPTTTPYGLIGKIVIPKGSTNNKALRLVFHLFGDTAIAENTTPRNVAFSFEYSGISASNSRVPSNYNIVDNSSYSPSTNPIEFSLISSPQAYTAYTSVKISDNFIIPADFIREDSVINFKIQRVSVIAGLNSYLGNVGLLGVYWEIIN